MPKQVYITWPNGLTDEYPGEPEARQALADSGPAVEILEEAVEPVEGALSFPVVVTPDWAKGLATSTEQAPVDVPKADVAKSDTSTECVPAMPANRRKRRKHRHENRLQASENGQGQGGV